MIVMTNRNRIQVRMDDVYHIKKIGAWSQRDKPLVLLLIDNIAEQGKAKC
jgi:hypothetical protein